MDKVFEVVDHTGRRVHEILYKNDHDAFAVVGRCVAINPGIAQNYRVHAVPFRSRA